MIQLFIFEQLKCYNAEKEVDRTKLRIVMK